jgi:hypothetical protein
LARPRQLAADPGFNDGPSMRMVMLQAVEQRVDEGLFLEQLMPLGQIEI